MDLQKIFEENLEPFRTLLGELPFDILASALIALVAWLLARAATKALHRALEGSSVAEVSLLQNVVRVAVGLCAVWFAGQNVFHVEMSGIVQALGVTTLVVSLGMQDLIKNVVAGIQVVTTQLLKVGDQIQLDDHRGEVTDVNWRQTTIVDKDGDPHVIPNAELMGDVFVRLDGKMARRHDIDLHVKHGLDLDAVSADICRLADATLDERGWRAEEHTEVRFQGTTVEGVHASVRIYITDIRLTTRAIDAVTRAVEGRGYLADWANDYPAHDAWRQDGHQAEAVIAGEGA